MNNLPPGTSSKAYTSYRVLKDPFFWMEKWKEQYGDPFCCETLNGPVVVTGNPKGIEQIYKANPEILRPFAMENAGAYFGTGSLFITYGEKHKKDRKLLTPPFHGQRMKAYGDTMARITRETLLQIEPNQEFTMLDQAQRISLHVILETIFGFREADSIQTMADLVHGIIESLHPSFMFSTALQNKLWPPWRKFQSYKIKYYDQILIRIKELQSGEANGEDILSLLLSAEYDDGSKMSSDELTDQLNTLLVAGHETTAITLAWAMYWILRDRDVLNKLRDEINGLGPKPLPIEYTKLPYLTAVLKETMRIRPILTEMIRSLAGPLELLGYTLPAGYNVATSISLVHFNPEVYTEAEKFMPERFLENKYSPFEFIPFGGGHRRCIGAAFAEFEMKIALGIFIGEAEWELLDKKPVETVRRNITMAPKGGIRLIKTSAA